MKQKHKINIKNKTAELPSAAEDCADVTSKYQRYKNQNKKSKLPPVKYEKPPHY